jgi:predicted RNA-binding protein with PUA-like domain
MSAMPSQPDRRFWLFKSEPEVFSIDHLAGCPSQTTFWDGVRNYQARNMLRDEVRVGDGVLFYHSNAEPLAIVGLARVVRDGYPDHTAWDAKSAHPDPKSTPEKPIWYMVDIALETRFAQPVERTTLARTKGLEKMLLLQRGSRLSIQPVTSEEWRIVLKLAGRGA